MTLEEKIAFKLKEESPHIYQEICEEIKTEENANKPSKLWVAHLEVKEPVLAPSGYVAREIAVHDVDWQGRLSIESDLVRIYPLRVGKLKDYEGSIPWGEEYDRTCEQIYYETVEEA